MGDISYENFDLLIERVGEGFRARVQVADRQYKRDFSLADDQPVMSRLMEALAGRGARGPAEETNDDDVVPEAKSLTQLGTALYSTVFDDEVRDALKTALERSVGPSAGLRIRLRLDAPELAHVAWELLCDPTSMRFPVLSEKTPLVRYLDLAQPRDPLPVTAPLRILVAVSSPKGVPELEVEREWQELSTALRGLIASGKVDVERLSPPTLTELRSRLLEGEYHVFHFIGHGVFDPGANEGYLLFENAEGGPRAVSGDDLGTWFADHFSLRLAVLNSCQGGVTSDVDPFAGVAQKLIQQGTPAVIAMQCAISDLAAITFSEGFYQALATGRPLEAAVATGRKAIRTDVSDIEWATPVLYSRLPSGALFEIDELSPDQRALLNEQLVLQVFWNPTLASTVTLFFGKRAAEPSEMGEVEPVVGLPYAMMLGEIRQFLDRFFEKVIVTDDRDQIDPDGALITLGGPVTNPVTAAIVEETPLPLWFLGMPYTAGRERSVGTEVDTFKPQLAEGKLASDVGLGARIAPAGGPPKFVIAGCYGAGTLGVARLFMSADAVKSFGPLNDVARFEVVARSHLAGWDVAHSEVLATRPW
jgi:CHAT domain-containing protein